MLPLYKFYTVWAFCMHLVYWACPKYMPSTFLVAVFVWLGAEVLMRCVIPRHVTATPSARATHLLVHVLPVFVVGWIARRRRRFAEVDVASIDVLLYSLIAYMLMYGGDVPRVFDTYRRIGDGRV